MRQQSIAARLDRGTLQSLQPVADELGRQSKHAVASQQPAGESVHTRYTVQLRYEGSDSLLDIPLTEPDAMQNLFADAHREQFGFAVPDQPVVVENLLVETTGSSEKISLRPAKKRPAPVPVAKLPFYCSGQWHQARWFERKALGAGCRLDGPVVIFDASSTAVVDRGWDATVLTDGHLQLERQQEKPAVLQTEDSGRESDPILLEVFNNLFMHIATQMGVVLRNTAHSVNIKERLDFSCALFDAQGGLIANAPHMPVHLGSMGDSVAAVIRKHQTDMQVGDSFALNAPYDGGTHLPDITVITPIWFDSEAPAFFLAARAHHADIGGTTPGSMPPDSRHIDDEGVLIDNLQIVREGRLDEALLRDIFSSGLWPARNPQQNIEDLKAQIAANRRGQKELATVIAHYGLQTVQAYMRHVQDNAEESVRRAIDGLQDGEFSCAMDSGQTIKVAIDVHRASRSAVIDFSGTSAQSATNFNAPSAVCTAAVLYVFRTLVDHNIPLNQGCLKPLRIRIPKGSMLAPEYPAAVVAGNVETSQCIVDALYGALGIQAASQGTMNNLTFGDERWQYYETICGGSGAGDGYDGTDAVHTHMTNSRLTDPEVLESRFPVRLLEFSIRSGSGGNGKFTGGNGTRRRLQFLKPMTAAILSGRRDIAPFGLCGGSAGATGENQLQRANGEIIPLAAATRVEVETGDILIVSTPGGGGFGKPDGNDNQQESPNR
jgi:5-oxoprolinase (ATP-hydrolysing)